MSMATVSGMTTPPVGRAPPAPAEPSAFDPEPAAAPPDAAAAAAGGADPAPARDAGPRLAWPVGVGGSLALHGLVMLAILFGVTRLAPPASSPEDIMTVEIAPAGAPPTPLRQTPPGPQRVRATVKPAPVRQVRIPPPPRLDVPHPEAVVPVKPDPQPDRQVRKQAAEQTTAPQPVPAPPKPVAAAPTAGASTQASNAAQTWGNLVVARLARSKRYPPRAQAEGQQDEVWVRMAIDRSGRLIDAQIVRSHGYAMLDREVLSLARRAGPYPPPPASEGDPAVVAVPVDFFITRLRR